MASAKTSMYSTSNTLGVNTLLTSCETCYSLNYLLWYTYGSAIETHVKTNSDITQFKLAFRYKDACKQLNAKAQGQRPKRNTVKLRVFKNYDSNKPKTKKVRIGSQG